MVLFFENPMYPTSYLAKYNLTSLDIDEGVLNVTSTVQQPMWMYSLSSECHRCPYTKMFEVSGGHTKNVVIETTFQNLWKIYETDRGHLVDEGDKLVASRAILFFVYSSDVLFIHLFSTQYCEIRPVVDQFGIYNLVIDEDQSCVFTVEKEGVNILTRKNL